MSEAANETVETIADGVAMTEKPAKAKKKPAKEPEVSKSSEPSDDVKATPNPRKSIYWPSVQSFAKKELVAEAIKAACERLEVTEPLEISVPMESFGSMRDVLESLAMLDKTNAEEADIDGLAACLHVMNAK